MAQKFIGETSGKYWKQKNDETYVNEKELVKITDLEETTSVDDSDLLIKGNPSAGTMLKIKVANFLDGIKEKLLGSTDISSIGDGTVTGAISANASGVSDNAKTITENKEDADSKYTELNSALTPSWTTVTLTSDFTEYQSGSTPQYCKVGGVVTLCGIITPTGTLSGGSDRVTICTLPSGYRPPMELSFICQGSGRYRWCCCVQSGGAVHFTRYANESGYGDCTNGTWLPFAVTFAVS